MYEDDEEREQSVETIGIVDVKTPSRRFHCRDCNTTFMNFGSNVVDHCCICGGMNLDTGNEPFEKKPSMVLFQKTLEDAKQEYRNKVLFHPLVPFVFKSNATIQSIQKVYLPVFLVDANVSGTLDFLAGDKTTIMKEKVPFIETKKYSVVEQINFDYNHIMLNLSSKIQDRLFHTICDYTFDRMIDFNPVIIDDSAVLVGDRDINEVAEAGRQRIMKHALTISKSRMNHALKKMNKNGAVVNFSNSREVLVPVYFLTIHYKDKDYIYFMNGENGKVSLELVFGKVEIILFSLFMFALIFLIGFLIAYYM